MKHTITPNNLLPVYHTCYTLNQTGKSIALKIIYSNQIFETCGKAPETLFKKMQVNVDPLKKSHVSGGCYKLELAKF